jgi:dTDP-glucose 4,6-dehydratase
LTGHASNLDRILTQPGFRFDNYDVTNYIHIEGPVEWVLHFASPASPRDYFAHPIHTMKVGAIGTMHSLGLAKAKGARFMLASTSEAYGDPQVHPQPESYWGHVNPVGPRGVYDEAKRFAEAMAMAYHHTHGVPVKIIRIFNTYGPRMRRADGRAVPNFIEQALTGKPLTVHGDGRQTRSLCYVDDLIEGIWRYLNAEFFGVMNIGNPHEITVLELAKTIVELAHSNSELTFKQRPLDDPEMRCPDISLAHRELGWEPRVDLNEGLSATIMWARENWDLLLASL